MLFRLEIDCDTSTRSLVVDGETLDDFLGIYRGFKNKTHPDVVELSSSEGVYPIWAYHLDMSKMSGFLVVMVEEAPEQAILEVDLVESALKGDVESVEVLEGILNEVASHKQE